MRKALPLALVLLTASGLLWAQELAPAKSEPEPIFKFYSTVFGTNVPQSGGFTGLVYALKPGEEYLPNFNRRKPISKIWTASLNVPSQDFSRGFPGIPNRVEWFAIDYKGEFWIETAGRYRFALTSDDGSILYIDGHLIIDNDGVHPAVTRQETIRLKAGLHSIRVSYFQGPRWQLALTLHVICPGQRPKIFDTKDFPIPPK